MRLAALLNEIETAPGPVTGIELALKLGVSPGEVAMMLDALRAAGKLGEGARKESESCSSAGSCSMTCPGPDECSLVIDVSISGLEVQRPSAG